MDNVFRTVLKGFPSIIEEFLTILSRVIGSLITGYVAHRYYKRSGLGWFSLSLVFNPFVAFVFLFVAGWPFVPEIDPDAPVHFLDRRVEDPVELTNSQTTCPFCGAVINLFSGEGLIDETEEINQIWVFRCATCQTLLPIDFLEDALQKQTVI